MIDSHSCLTPIVWRSGSAPVSIDLYMSPCGYFHQNQLVRVVLEPDFDENPSKNSGLILDFLKIHRPASEKFGSFKHEILCIFRILSMDVNCAVPLYLDFHKSIWFLRSSELHTALYFWQATSMPPLSWNRSVSRWRSGQPWQSSPACARFKWSLWRP